jgi:flagellar biosynthesis anti-sigma factor FlgM
MEVMKIQGDGNLPREIGRIDRSDFSRAPERTDASAFHREDVVELSPARLEMNALVQRVHQAPDVRLARVEALRQAVAEGSYHVDAVKLADRLIDHMLGRRV